MAQEIRLVIDHEADRTLKVVAHFPTDITIGDVIGALDGGFDVVVQKYNRYARSVGYRSMKEIPREMRDKIKMDQIINL